MSDNTFLYSLTKFLKEKISKEQFVNSEDYLRNIDLATPIGNSVLDFKLSYDDELKFLKSIGLTSDDVGFLQNVSSSAGYYSNFYSNENEMENFLDGHTFDRFLNQENTKKLNLIANYIYPSVPFNTESINYFSKLAEIMNSMFPSEVSDIVDFLANEKESALGSSIQDKIINELNSYLEDYNIKIVSRWGRFQIKAIDLLKIYYLVGDDEASPLKILKKYFQNADRGIGGWEENIWDYEDSDYLDERAINIYISNKFDDIIEFIESDKSGMKEFLGLRNRTLSKFNINVWYNLPKNDRYLFIIRGFDKEKLKLEVGLKDRFSSLNKNSLRLIELSEENFYHLLYQPTLFNLEEI